MDSYEIYKGVIYLLFLVFLGAFLGICGAIVNCEKIGIRLWIHLPYSTHTGKTRYKLKFLQFQMIFAWAINGAVGGGLIAVFMFTNPFLGAVIATFYSAFGGTHSLSS